MPPPPVILAGGQNATSPIWLCQTVEARRCAKSPSPSGGRWLSAAKSVEGENCILPHLSAIADILPRWGKNRPLPSFCPEGKIPPPPLLRNGGGKTKESRQSSSPNIPYMSFSFCAAFSPLYKEKKRQRKRLSTQLKHAGVEFVQREKVAKKGIINSTQTCRCRAGSSAPAD